MTAAKVQGLAKISAGIRLPEVPLDRLRESYANPRKSFDSAGQAELVESIREHGMQVPLIIRVFPDSALHAVADGERVRAGELFEIICGHRRFRAARELGMKTVPCIQRDLTDDQAREIGLVDNLQRADVPPLEEADAYRELQQRLGTAAAIAQRVGKEAGYVAKRLQLVSLGDMPRRALAERLIAIDHALLLARLGEQEQLTNLKWLLNPNAGMKEKVEDVIAGRLKDRAESKSWGWHEPQSPLQLKMHIEEHVGRKLSRAPWDLDDVKLVPEAAACNGCPSNTADNTALFGDLSIDAATCENGRCFESKRAAYVQISLDRARAVSPESLAPRLSWKDSQAKPRSLQGVPRRFSRLPEAPRLRRQRFVDEGEGGEEGCQTGTGEEGEESRPGVSAGTQEHPSVLALRLQWSMVFTQSLAAANRDAFRVADRWYARFVEENERDADILEAMLPLMGSRTEGGVAADSQLRLFIGPSVLIGDLVDVHRATRTALADNAGEFELRHGRVSVSQDLERAEGGR